MEFHSDFGVFFFLLATLGMFCSAFLALGAVGVGIWYARSTSSLARFAYWAVSCVTIIGLLSSASMGVLPRALFGPLVVDPSKSRQNWSDIEYFNVLTSPLLAVFFSVPYWRRRRQRAERPSPTARGTTLR